jgi:hypothetical protein
MITLEVSLNGKRVCTAGTQDLGVLTAHVTAVGILGKKTKPLRSDETGTEIHYSVGGLTFRQDPKKDVHLRWKSVAPLQVGDVIQVRILESEKADRASSRQKADRRPGEQSGFRQRRGRASVSKRRSTARRA